MADTEDVLRDTPLFESLSEEDAKALRSGIIDVHLDRGERLFAEGDAGDKLYIILGGKIKLTKAAPDGRENLLSVHGPGEMFGELSLFDPIPRTSSATAVTATRLAGLTHEDLRTWLSTRPEVAIHLLQALAQRLRRINDVKADLVFTDVPGRVAKALLDLLRPVRRAYPGWRPGQPRPHSGGTGSARRGIQGDGQQGLADFAARGWIQLAAKSVSATDTDRLRKRAR